MALLGLESQENLQILNTLITQFYGTSDDNIRRNADTQLTQYMKSQNAAKLLQHVIASNNQQLVFYAVLCFFTYVKLNQSALSFDDAKGLFTHLTFLYNKYAKQMLNPSLSKLQQTIGLTSSLLVLKSETTPLEVLNCFTSIDDQTSILHFIFDTIDILPYDSSALLQKRMYSFQNQLIPLLLQTNNLKVTLLLSDIVGHSTTFDKKYLIPFLNLVLSAISHNTSVEEAMDLYSAVFIRMPEVVEEPLKQLTLSILSQIVTMNTSSSLEVLVTFAISFYDTPHLQQVMPILLTYCRESLEYSSDVMCFFEEMFTLFEETPTLQALMQSFSAEYLKILIVECCVSDADDEVVATRSKLRSGLCSVKEMCNDYFNILTTALLQYKDNPRVIESVCFLWEAVDTLPSQLSHISIHRP